MADTSPAASPASSDEFRDEYGPEGITRSADRPGVGAQSPATAPAVAPAVALVGVHGGRVFGDAAERTVAGATVLFGAPRHLEAVAARADVSGARTVELGSDMAVALDRMVAERDLGERVCVVVSGDPGFFGLLRLAQHRLGPDALAVHPAPSAVALAFAAAGRHWDDAVVVSAHGRAPEAAVEAILRYPKVAVLCSPATPPQEVGRLVVEQAAGPATRRDVLVASRLGEAEQSIWRGDLEGLAAGRFDALSVVIALAPDRPAAGPGWSWGRPESDYEHRGGMITKAEVRAVALGKLAIPAAGVLWDVGAGSGSVSAEVTALAPGLAVYAVERRSEDVPMLRRNLDGTAAVVVEGTAPGCLAALPDPDRVFIGGGGIEVLDAALHRLRPGGTIVATYAGPERASAAAARLGHMVQVGVNRAVPIGPDGSLRLAAENPVFICWGPQP